ncbi:MAG: hypothetical protein LKK12_00580 [Bacteroidales bacterium]|jgi:hypothetical protein|nr:hypothetical protein [Bacteroidales bacterium]MCI2132861.1 hypothetical protein [Bacteroidales bacterium]
MSTILASGTVCNSSLLHTAWLRTCGTVCDSRLLHTASLQLDNGRVLDTSVKTGDWNQQLK